MIDSVGDLSVQYKDAAELAKMAAQAARRAVDVVLRPAHSTAARSLTSVRSHTGPRKLQAENDFVPEQGELACQVVRCCYCLTALVGTGAAAALALASD